MSAEYVILVFEGDSTSGPPPSLAATLASEGFCQRVGKFPLPDGVWAWPRGDELSDEQWEKSRRELIVLLRDKGVAPLVVAIAPPKDFFEAP